MNKAKMKKSLNRLNKYISSIGGVVSVNPDNSGAVCTVDIFGESGLDKAIKKLHWTIKNNDIYNEEKKPLKCSICNTHLSKENLAAFFPNSLDQVCDKPSCFITAISKAKKYER